MDKKTVIFNPQSMQIREAGEGKGESRTITGTAIVFDKAFEYVDYWGDTYREIISPKAVTKEFLESQDIKLNLLHKRSDTVARYNKGVGNLIVSVDAKGVNFEFEAPRCDIGDRCLEMVRNGVYTGCSFEFFPKDYECKDEKREDGKHIYTVTHTAFEKLDALTIAMDPCYKETHVESREAYKVTGKEQMEQQREAKKHSPAFDYSAMEREIEMDEIELGIIR